MAVIDKWRALPRPITAVAPPTCLKSVTVDPATTRRLQLSQVGSSTPTQRLDPGRQT